MADSRGVPVERGGEHPAVVDSWLAGGGGVTADSALGHPPVGALEEEDVEDVLSSRRGGNCEEDLVIAGADAPEPFERVGPEAVEACGDTVGD